MALQADAPGSLLLAGEYAVTEEGGLGIALAVAVCATCVLRPSSHPEIELTYGGETHRFATYRDPECPQLVAAAIEATASAEVVQDCAIALDTSAFFDGERKLGFGSSASATVALVAALLAARSAPQSDPPRADDREAVLQASVAAHRLSQGGRGSGYDAAISCLGGAGLFYGGDVPSIEPVALPWLPNCYLFRGPAAVKTSGAVARYQQWKTQVPADATQFVQASNAAVTAAAKSGTWEEARSHLIEARAIGEELGCAIGVPAQPVLPPSVQMVIESADKDSVFYKSLGAGNETGLLMTGDTALHDVLMTHGLLQLRLSADGVRVR